MIARFATCDTVRAVGFLKTQYGDRLINEETCPLLFSALRNDILRITDPAYHTLAIISGSKYSGDVDAARAVLNEIESTPIERSEG